MDQYINHSKDLINHILVDGNVLTNIEKMLYVLSCLDSGYKSLVIPITNKKRVLSLEELFIRLRTHDKQLKRMNLPDSQLMKINYFIHEPNFPNHQSQSLLAGNQSINQSLPPPHLRKNTLPLRGKTPPKTAPYNSKSIKYLAIQLPNVTSSTSNPKIDSLTTHKGHQEVPVYRRGNVSKIHPEYNLPLLDQIHQPTSRPHFQHPQTQTTTWTKKNCYPLPPQAIHISGIINSLHKWNMVHGYWCHSPFNQ